MIFVRNENDRHNPDETMLLEVFSDAWRVLARYIDDLLQKSKLELYPMTAW